MMRSFRFVRTLAALCALALVTEANAAAQTTSTYEVTVDTSPLVGHPAGPFVAMFALTDSSGIGDGNSTVTIHQVTFGGGGPLGTPFTIGNATGTLDTTVTLTDSELFGAFTQSFSPGNTLRFTVSVTNTPDPSGAPDRLSLFLIDGFGVRIPTLALQGDTLVGIDLGWLASGGPESFAGDTSRARGVGAPIAIAAPVIVAACATAISTGVTVTRGGFVYNPGTERFSQTVRLTNASGVPITGPIYLVLDGLTPTVSLANPTGSTTCAAPEGSPVIGVAGGSLAADASVSTVLQFTNPNKAGITYTARVLAGAATR